MKISFGIVILRWSKRKKKSVSIRESSRFRTTYTTARKKTPHSGALQRVLLCSSYEGPNFDDSQGTESGGIAA